MEDTLHESMESYEARDVVYQAIRQDASLTDYQRNQLYDTLLIKGTSDSQYDKYVAVSGTVTKDEYVDAMIQAQLIKGENEDVEEGRATLMATEFSKYLDMMGYDKQKRSALQGTFKFYSMFPAEPQNYSYDMLAENGGQKEKLYVSELENAGLTAEKYLEIKKAAGDAAYEKGKTGAKLEAVGKIVRQSVETDAALWARFKAAVSAPVKIEEDEDMSYDQFKKFMARYEAERDKRSISDYAKDAWAAMKAAGITDGSAPGAPLTREQYAVMQ